MAYINDRNLVGKLLCTHTDCKHAAKLGAGYVCNYILDTGEKRPCKATPGCTEYVSGKHEYRNDYTKSVPQYWGRAKDYEV